MSEAGVVAPGAPRKSLRHDVSMMLLGRVVYLACQGGALIALARLGEAADVGVARGRGPSGGDRVSCRDRV
jgi:hypothetical protein